MQHSRQLASLTRSADSFLAEGTLIFQCRLYAACGDSFWWLCRPREISLEYYMWVESTWMTISPGGDRNPSYTLAVYTMLLLLSWPTPWAWGRSACVDRPAGSSNSHCLWLGRASGTWFSSDNMAGASDSRASASDSKASASDSNAFCASGSTALGNRVSGGVSLVWDNTA